MAANGSSAMTSCRRCRGFWPRPSTARPAHDASLYALSQAAVIVAFIAVWMTARPLVGAIGALAAMLIIDGMHYFTLSAAKFNHNVVELPFWALAGFAFYAGAATGQAAPLDLARRCARARLVGEIFCRDPGGAAGAVFAVRSATRAAGWPHPDRGSPPSSRSLSWRRIFFGCGSTARSPSVTRKRARRRRAARSITSCIRCNSSADNCSFSFRRC